MAKYYSPALVRHKRKRTWKSIILGQQAEQTHYRATHKTEKISILWLEACQFGKINSFPCVLDEDGDRMVYFSSKTNARENTEMIRRWNLFVTPQNIQTEWDVEEIPKGEFYKLYHQIQAEELDKISKANQARDEAGESAALTEGEPEAEEEQPVMEEAEKQE